MLKLYCLDTNILIEGWTKHYAIDLCPDYWEILDRLAKENRIFCTMEVFREIEKADDGLAAWAEKRPHLFRELDEKVFECLQRIYHNPDSRRLVDSSKFRSVADPWVIAHAMAEKAVVVTKEGFETNRTNRVKIPNVCEDMGVPCIGEFEFVGRIGIRFRAQIGN